MLSSRSIEFLNSYFFSASGTLLEVKRPSEIDQSAQMGLSIYFICKKEPQQLLLITMQLLPIIERMIKLCKRVKEKFSETDAVTNSKMREHLLLEIPKLSDLPSELIGGSGLSDCLAAFFDGPPSLKGANAEADFSNSLKGVSNA
jgi:hypothetical protein